MPEFINPAWKSQNIHVVGFSGIEGYTVTQFLLKQGCENITVHDYGDESAFRRNFFRLHQYLERKERKQALEALLAAPITVQWGGQYLQQIDQADLIFVSQNWFAYQENKPLLSIKEQHPECFSSLIQLYFQLKPCRLVGVTGTNGKSTTVDLITKMLELGDNNVWYGGNERTKAQALLFLEQIQPTDFLVLEVSNRHLREDLGASPEISVVTNITPNHIADHGSWEAYQQAKKSLVQYQQTGDLLILNQDDLVSQQWFEEIQEKIPQQVLRFSQEEKASAYWNEQALQLDSPEGEVQVVSRSELVEASEHFLSNAAAATLVAQHAGVEVPAIAQVIQQYHGLPGRLEFIGEAEGIRFYYDIKSTVPQATVAALHSFEGSVWLILGGEDKGVDYIELAQAIPRKCKKVFLLPGSVSDMVHNLFDADDQKIFRRAENINEVWEVVEQEAQSGDVILLSPAGEHFYENILAGQKGMKDLVRRLGSRK